MAKIGEHFNSITKTIVCFTIFYMCIPLCLLCYLIVSVTRTIWMNILSTKYSHLEFIKTNNIRSFLDKSRNPGVIHVLLHIEGKCDIENVKEKLFKYILDRQDKAGRLCYPRLRTSFISCWGMYAWIRNASKFNINNHVILCPATYRGRAVVENNIQEYVSSIVSKYIPADIPQWQIFIIPSGSVASTADNTIGDNYYMLVRIHHLVLSEEPDLSLRDMLLLDSFSSLNVSFKKTQEDIIAEPLKNLVDSPIHIPKLYNQIMVSVCNRWNEFIYDYDSLESHDNNMKKTQISGLSQLLSIIIISFVTILLDFYKGFYAIKSDPTIKLRFLTSIVKREVKKRNLSFACVGRAILFTLHPLNVFTTMFGVIWWFGVTWTIVIPYGLYKEIVSCSRYCWSIEQTDSGYIVEYMPLIYNAAKEFANILQMILTAPRNIYEDLFERHRYEQTALQNLSLCGRKVISWSDKININDVKKICRMNKLSDTELYFSASSAALNDFLDEFKCKVPKHLGACAGYVGHEYLLGKKNYAADANGYLCLKFPLQPPSAEQINNIRQCFQTARQKQISLMLLDIAQRRYQFLTKMIPAPWIQLLFNFLSRKFTILITQIEESSHNQMAITLWGHKVIDALYFTPPQSNISVSLTLQHFGEYIRLSVMTDLQISPLHSKISQSWTNYLNEIIGNY